MSQDQIITAVDIGTDKCVTLIAKWSEEARIMKVVGVSAVPSRGMKRSQIIDLEQVMETVSESLDGAERMAGVEVRSAYVSVGGAHIHSLNSKGVVAVASPEQEVTTSDIERVIEAARAVSLPSDKEIIHVIPNTYKVDSQEGIKDPVGMTGIRLESEVHVITAMSTALKNLQRVMENLGLSVNAFVFSGLAASEVVLSETEKELGVCLVDIGAGSTSLCAYSDGSLVFSAAIPVGARHITQDIALGCRVGFELAEKIKLSLLSEALKSLKPQAGESKQDFNARRRRADELHLEELTQGEVTDVLSKKTLIDGIIAPRVTELFGLIYDALEKQRLLLDIPAGLVLTGGGAETIGIVQLAKQHFKMPCRIGLPTELDGLTIDIHKSAYATSIGLIMYGKNQRQSNEGEGFSLSSLLQGKSLSALMGKISSMVKSLLP